MDRHTGSHDAGGAKLHQGQHEVHGCGCSGKISLVLPQLSIVFLEGCSWHWEMPNNHVSRSVQCSCERSHLGELLGVPPSVVRIFAGWCLGSFMLCFRQSMHGDRWVSSRRITYLTTYGSVCLLFLTPDWYSIIRIQMTSVSSIPPLTAPW